MQPDINEKKHSKDSLFLAFILFEIQNFRE